MFFYYHAGYNLHNTFTAASADTWNQSFETKSLTDQIYLIKKIQCACLLVCRWLGAGLLWLQCVSNGVAVVLRWAIDTHRQAYEVFINAEK